METQSLTTPRILKEHFRSHRGAAVIVVGKITSIHSSSNTLVLEVNQEKNITVDAKIDTALIDMAEFDHLLNTYLQVTGTISQEEGTIEVREYCKFGSDFDLKTYNELVQLSNEQFKKLFRP